MHLAGAGEDQQVMVRGGDKDFFYKIFFFRAHTHLASAAAVLALVKAHRVALDIAGM